jgi:hypothetical protein
LGNELINPIVIGHHKSPRDFSKWNPQTLVDFYWNKTAWMTMDIFKDWLIKTNKKLRLQNRHVALLLDNAGGHKITEET